jgi:very-short-patch-repair endonuclease
MNLKYNGSLNEKAKDLRKNATPWENKLWYEYLNTCVPRFQRQKAIGNYIVDFYCGKAKLAVELDGGGHYEKDKQAKDELRTKQRNSQGITVIRFSNFEVDTNFYEVCSAIDNAVKSRIGNDK